MIILGAFTLSSAGYSFFTANLSVFESGAVVGFITMVAGFLIVPLAAIATFFKIIAEVISEEKNN